MHDDIVGALRQTAVRPSATVDARSLYQRGRLRRARRQVVGVATVCAAVFVTVLVVPWRDAPTQIALERPGQRATPVVDPMLITPRWGGEASPLGTFGGERNPMGPVQIGDTVVVATKPERGVVQGISRTTSEVLWTYRTGDDSAFIGPYDGNIVLVAPQQGPVAAVDVQTGIRQWAVATAGTPGTPTIVDSVVYLPVSYTGEGDTTAPEVLAIDVASGEVSWTAVLEEGSDLQWYPPVVTEELVLIADTPSHPGSAETSHLHAVDRDSGSTVWVADLRTDKQGFHYQRPVVTDRLIFTVARGGVVAIDAGRGSVIWRRKIDGAVRIRRADDNVLILTVDGSRIVLDPHTGAKKQTSR